MNGLDLLVVFVVTGLMVAFIRFAYEWGYREGHGDGYLRGRATAKALKENEAAR